VTRVVVFGVGAIAELAHFYLTHDSPHEVVGFTVDSQYVTGDDFHGLPVTAFEELDSTHTPGDVAFFAPISFKRMNHVRAEKVDRAKEMGFELISYVSSKASTFPDFTCGENCFILEDNTIQPFVAIGDDVIMWSGNHIGHHSVIRDNCFIASHVVVSGSVDVGESCFVGVNATFVNDITVGADSWIGPHVVVTRDVAPRSVMRPARSEVRRIDALEMLGIPA
jgi:sugar O-acyltransferase (sialic acid O-acetyltransferase NeuD family)